MADIERLFNELMCAYNDFKKEVKDKDKFLFERWKAGGFIVDPDIMSMYPDATKVFETLADNEEEEEDFDEDEIDCTGTP